MAKLFPSRIALLSSMILLLSACTLLGNRDGTEQRSYKVVESLGDEIEIRSYSDAVYADASVPEEEENARNQAFRKLFRYIQGENEGEREIAMTAPVSIGEGTPLPRTTPSTQITADGMVTMRFYHPASFSIDTAPIPTEDGVTLGVERGTMVAVLRFSGSTKPDFADEKRAALLQALSESAWKADGESYAMYYDPPWTLPPMRRNEVAIPVKPR